MRNIMSHSLKQSLGSSALSKTGNLLENFEIYNKYKFSFATDMIGRVYFYLFNSEVCFVALLMPKDSKSLKLSFFESK